MIPRFGDAPERGCRYRMRAGAYAVLVRDGHVLATYQHAPHEEFQLPGGGIDAGESPVAALHREVFEETGWRISTPRKLGMFRRFTWMPEYGYHAEKLCHIYLARPIRQLGEPTEPGHSAVWLQPDVAARVMGNSGDAAFVRGVFA